MFKRVQRARALAILGLIAAVSLSAMPAGGQTTDRFGMWRWNISAGEWCTLSPPQILARIDFVGRKAELERAVGAREPAALTLLGMATDDGVGGYANNDGAAHDYYQLAAAARFPRAMNAYGWALEHGYRKSGKPSRADLEQSLTWYRSAAAAGCLGAVNATAVERQLRGPATAPPAAAPAPARDRFGIWRWNISAGEWCTLSRDQIMARVDYYGRRQEMYQAAQAGEGAANVLLGYAYERGLANLSRSGNLAQAFHRRAAEGGFPRGMNAYGGALETGITKGGNPTRADIELSLKWYRASAAAGCAKGRENAVFLEKWLRDHTPAPARPTYSCHDQCRGRGPADPTARAAVYDMCVRSCEGRP